MSAVFAATPPAANLPNSSGSGMMVIDPISGQLPIAQAARPGFYSAWLAEADAADTMSDVGLAAPVGARMAASFGSAEGLQAVPADAASAEVAVGQTPASQQSHLAEMLGVGLLTAEVKLSDEEEEHEDESEEVEKDKD
jgi:hypothetical protein